MSDHEEEEEGALNGSVPAPSAASACGAASGPAVAAGKKPALSRNTNFDDVVKADKERRDLAKQEAVRKKEKDKEDRCVFTLSTTFLNATLMDIIILPLDVLASNPEMGHLSMLGSAEQNRHEKQNSQI